MPTVPQRRARKKSRRRCKTFSGEILNRQEATWPLSQLARLLPCKPRYTRIWWWCTHGRKHPYTHEVIHLEAIHETQGLASSVEAYQRFLARLNEW